MCLFQRETVEQCIGVLSMKYPPTQELSRYHTMQCSKGKKYFKNYYFSTDINNLLFTLPVLGILQLQTLLLAEHLQAIRH